MSSTNKVSSPRIWSLNSPTLYLFAGIALMMGLIAVALIILACSYRKQPSRSRENQIKEMTVAAGVDPAPPEIVVILPGDDMPTCLAKPIPSSNP
ncbi:hypothetical protein Nepgr_029091 [Nepenthes gracilis]|uniref:Uncharacterized protein n=1 Tax=Nepenthes gracilis TaxID=150966 RepID=A0AAD3TDL1_NEPGR|nr:hypothetical protein Nepgr_029091 [Nepenthes gracilis]